MAGVVDGGICLGLPVRVQDLMWGPDRVDDPRAQARLTGCAIELCGMCPMQPDCLALSIVNRDQYGVAGGLPVRARRELRRLAESDGVDVDAASARFMLAKWLREHPDQVEQARRNETARTNAHRRLEEQRRWRAKKAGRLPADAKPNPKPEQ